MSEQARIERKVSKTEASYLLWQLEEGFKFAPRIAKAIVEEATAVLRNGNLITCAYQVRGTQESATHQRTTYLRLIP